MTSPYSIDDLDVEAFSAWLTSQGAHVLPPTNEYEVLRYKASKAGVFVVYRKANGRLTWTGSTRRHWHNFDRGEPLGAKLPQPAGPSPKPKKPKRMSVRAKAKHREVIRDRDGHGCFYCSGPMSPRTESLEHLLPRSQGGPDDVSNLVLAHKGCNQTLGDLPLARKLALRDQMISKNYDEALGPPWVSLAHAATN